MKKLIIAVILFLSWGSLTGAYIYNSSNVSVLSNEHDRSVFTSPVFDEFLKGEKITGKFSATENYLGQVSIRFYNYDRINGDEVIFRIKELDSPSWYYENVYKTDQFQPNQLFPFGFPIIPDSAGKEYPFEVESVKGIPEDAVTMSQENPIFTTSYQYPKRGILTDPGTFIEFLSNKIAYTKYDLDFAFSLGIYINSILISLFLIYLFLNRFKFSFKSYHTVLVGVILLSLSAFLLSVKLTALSESLSIWAFFLLVIGLIQMSLEAERLQQ